MENILSFQVNLESGRKKTLAVYFDRYEYNEKRKITNLYAKDELIMTLDLNVEIYLYKENTQGLKFYEIRDLVKDELISLKEYAALHNVKADTVRQKILRGNLKAQKIGRNWVINKNEPYIDNRKKDE